MKILTLVVIMAFISISACSYKISHPILGEEYYEPRRPSNDLHKTANDTIAPKNEESPSLLVPKGPVYTTEAPLLMRSSSKYELDENKIYQVTDIPPFFLGGRQELTKFIANNYNYPEEDDANPSIEYRTSVTFVERKTGEITDIKRKRDDARTDYLLALVKRTQNW